MAEANASLKLVGFQHPSAFSAATKAQTPVFGAIAHLPKTIDILL